MQTDKRFYLLIGYFIGFLIKVRIEMADQLAMSLFKFHIMFIALMSFSLASIGWPQSASAKSNTLLQQIHSDKIKTPKEDLKEIVGIMDKKNQKLKASEKKEESLKAHFKKLSVQDREIAQAKVFKNTEQDQEGNKNVSVQAKGRADSSVERTPDHLVPLIRESLYDRERTKSDLDIYLTEQEQSLSMGTITKDLGDVEVQWEDDPEN